jgi:predicted DNA binding CopG/RHH family protein
MERKTVRVDVRISPTDRDQVKATAQELGVTFSRFVRTALKDTVALEAALLKQDERERGDKSD